MAWSEEARAAAAAARAAKAAEKKQPVKRGPRTKYTTPGNRSAFTLRKKMQHDAGKDARIAAANARTAGAHSTGIGSFVPKGGAAGLGLLAGLVGFAMKGATANIKKGR